MQIYRIAIEETVVEEFEVMANNVKEALEIAEEKYQDSEFVLTPGEVQHKQMSVIKPVVEATNWIEF
ncbi:MAG: hypothetical protein IJZ53_05820 [Tyzzerella sp.]|nr:hypothetical protein [Tyzzerella sp.]